MCSGKKNLQPSSPVKFVLEMAGGGALPNTRPPRQYQLSKPRLSRNVIPGVKINLNKYWSKFGEMVSPTARSTASLGTREMRIPRVEDVTEADDSHLHIAQQRFEVLGGLSEADENLINEIREICTSTINQYLNCKCY